MIVTIASIFVVTIAERYVLLLFGYEFPQGRGRSGMAIFTVLVAVGAAAGAFQLRQEALGNGRRTADSPAGAKTVKTVRRTSQGY